MNKHFLVAWMSVLLASARITYADSIPKLVERRIDMYYPGQLSRDTTIAFGLDDTCDLLIVAYGMNGLPVDTIEHALKGPGTHTIVWSPRPDMPAGKYHIELTCGELRMSQGVLYGDYEEPYPRTEFSFDSAITYVLTDTCAPVIIVRNVLAQPIDTIVQELAVPGKYRHIWRPKRPVPSGIYFWHLKCGTHDMKKAFMWLNRENNQPKDDDR